MPWIQWKRRLKLLLVCQGLETIIQNLVEEQKYV